MEGRTCSHEGSLLKSELAEGARECRSADRGVHPSENVSEWPWDPPRRVLLCLTSVARPLAFLANQSAPNSKSLSASQTL